MPDMNNKLRAEYCKEFGYQFIGEGDENNYISWLEQRINANAKSSSGFPFLTVKDDGQFNELSAEATYSDAGHNIDDNSAADTTMNKGNGFMVHVIAKAVAEPKAREDLKGLIYKVARKMMSAADKL